MHFNYKSILLGTVFLTAAKLFGQEAHILDLQGPGTASVYISENDRTAYITDGGKSGAKGLMGATLDGQPILKALLNRQIERLVITCSHPHSDHMDGLVDLVKSEDIKNPQFTEVRFIDSAYPKQQSLHEMYHRQWGEPATTKVTYHSADNRNAFEGIGERQANVTVSNFVYRGMGEHPHGNCVITQYTLQRNRLVQRVVDFDDADSWLVKTWAEWAKSKPNERRPDTILLPHHGSTHTDINPILEESIRPKSAVITVNENNQYRHPGPSTLLRLLTVIGKDNVHFSSSQGNVVFDERGLASTRDYAHHRRNYEKFLARHYMKVETELLDLAQRIENGGLSPAEERRRTRLESSRKSYIAIRDELTIDPVETKRAAELAEQAFWERIRGESGGLFDGSLGTTLPKLPHPNEAVSPFLFAAETESVQEAKSEAQVKNKLVEMRDAIQTGSLSKAAQIASELEVWEGAGISPLERQTSQHVRQAEDLVAYLAGTRTSSIESAISWPELSDGVGAEALRQLTLRELKDIFATDVPVKVERLRLVADSLQQCGLDAPEYREVQAEIAFRLFLQGDVATATKILPMQLDANVADRILGDTKALLSGEGRVRSWAGAKAVESENVANPLFTGIAMSPTLTGDANQHVLSRMMNVVAAEGQRAIKSDVSKEMNKIRLEMLKTVDSRLALRESEAAARGKLVAIAEQAFPEPLLVSERATLWNHYSIGSSVGEAVSSIKSDRATTLSLARMQGELARSFGHTPKDFTFRTLSTMRNRELGFTETNVSKWQPLLIQRQVEQQLLRSLPKHPSGRPYRTIAEFHTEMAKARESMRSSYKTRANSRMRAYSRMRLPVRVR